MENGNQEENKEKLLQEYLKQKEELEKVINELQAQLICTNIPYSTVFLEKFPKNNSTSLMSTNPKTLLDIKLFVNKKCNQISNDVEHAKKLLVELKQKEEDPVFCDLFVMKLIEQGKIQVSSNIDFYKPLGFILSQMNGEIAVKYLKSAIYKETNNFDIKGMYAIYFGYLYFKDDFPSSWFFLASVLNCEPGKLTGPVLEIYFLILSELIAKYSKKRLKKILNYLSNFYFKKINNLAVETRIKTNINKYL
ncbi:hypothetical protein NUSPORA_00399 [Nucleospora cyclopteri]